MPVRAATRRALTVARRVDAGSAWTGLIPEPRVGPCSPRRDIEEWIETLLAWRSQMVGFSPALDEIRYHLRSALAWLEARQAGARCA